MKRVSLIIIYILVSCLLYGDALMKEYSFLYTDLLNCFTYGYKSHFSDETKMAGEIINLQQGYLVKTNWKSSFAIQGCGFFRIRMKDGEIAYTRNGDFVISEDGRFVSKNGYTLDSDFTLELSYVPDSIKVSQDGNYEYEYINNKRQHEKRFGSIKIYAISQNQIDREKNSVIYVKNQEMIKQETKSKIIQGFLEMSNVDSLRLLFRMLFLIEMEKRRDQEENSWNTKEYIVKDLITLFHQGIEKRIYLFSSESIELQNDLLEEITYLEYEY